MHRAEARTLIVNRAYHLGWSTDVCGHVGLFPLDLLRDGHLNTIDAALTLTDPLPSLRFARFGFNALHRACYHGRYELAKYLIEECGCDPHMPTLHTNKRGERPWVESRHTHALPGLDVIYPIQLAASCYVRDPRAFTAALGDCRSSSSSDINGYFEELTRSVYACGFDDFLKDHVPTRLADVYPPEALIAYLVHSCGCSTDVVRVNDDGLIQSTLEFVTCPGAVLSLPLPTEHPPPIFCLAPLLATRFGTFGMSHQPERLVLSFTNDLSSTRDCKEEDDDTTSFIAFEFVRHAQMLPHILLCGQFYHVDMLLRYLASRGWDMRAPPSTVGQMYNMRSIGCVEPIPALLPLCGRGDLAFRLRYFNEMLGYGVSFTTGDGYRTSDLSLSRIILLELDLQPGSTGTDELAKGLIGKLEACGCNFDGVMMNRHVRAPPMNSIAIYTPQIRQTLRDLGLPLDSNGMMPDMPLLHWLLSTGRPKLFMAFAAIGMNRMARDVYGRIPLFYAGEHLGLLLEAGVYTVDEACTATDLYGRTLLHYQTSMDATRILLAAYASPTARDMFGFTPLHTVGYAEYDEIGPFSLVAAHDWKDVREELSSRATSECEELFKGHLNTSLHDGLHIRCDKTLAALRRLARDVCMSAGEGGPSIATPGDLLTALITRIHVVYTIDVNVTDGVYGLTPAHIGVLSGWGHGYTSHPEDISFPGGVDWSCQTVRPCPLKLEHGPPFTIPCGSTPAHLAARTDRDFTLAAMYSEDFNIQDIHGRTPFHYVARDMQQCATAFNYTWAQQFRRCNQVPDAVSNPLPPLDEYLQRQLVDLRVPDNDGLTPYTMTVSACERHLLNPGTDATTAAKIREFLESLERFDRFVNSYKRKDALGAGGTN